MKRDLKDPADVEFKGGFPPSGNFEVNKDFLNYINVFGGEE